MNKQIIRSALFAAAVVTLIASSFGVSAADGYYRWLDAEGNTVLSDRPPPKGVSYDEVSSNSTSVRQIDSDAEGPSANAQAPADPVAKIEAAAKKPNKKDPKNCAVAQKNLSELSTSARIRMSDGQGGYRYLEDDEREAERLKATKAIEVYCP